jgi:penicillin-binding protein 1C
LLIILSLGIAAAAAASVFSHFAGTLPSPERVIAREIFKSVMIYDRRGELLYEAWDPNQGRRNVVQLKDMSPLLIDATLATEDPNFYENPGFDVRSIIRAAWQNFTNQRVVSGASTITQQLIKQTVLTPEERYAQTLERKAKEAIMAYQISQSYSKDQILQMYLNEIYYGNNSYGVEAAAQGYFGKPAKNLNLAEAAMLAGIPSSPVQMSPLTNFKGAKERQEQVLDLMVRHGYVRPDEAWKAKQEKLILADQKTEIKAPHFVMFVRELLEKRFGHDKMYSGGLRVYTTLDLQLQRKAEAIARQQLDIIAKSEAQAKVTNAAIVALDPRTAEILTMMGSVDFYNPDIDGQVNIALSGRQPGSALKPFTYLLAFSKGRAPASVVIDEPRSFPAGAGQPEWKPKNHDGLFLGPIRLRMALGGSRNIPAVLLLQQIGVENLVNTLHQAGITTLDQPERLGLSVTLGGGEVKLLDLTYAYCSLAANGVQYGVPVPQSERLPGYRELEPVAIAKVTDDAGRTIYEYKPGEGRRLFPPQLTFMVTDILSDDEARRETFGLNSVLKISRAAAVKTGTTDDSRDNWTIGYTPNFAAGVWLGNADNEPMGNLLAVAGAGRLWHDFMEEALKDRPVQQFQTPPGLVKATVGAFTGLLPAKDSPVVTDWFLEGMVPTEREPTPTPLPTATATPTATPKPVTPTPTATVMPGIRVPNVIRLSEAEARRRIEAAGLRNAFTNYQRESDVPPENRAFFRDTPPGTVLSQNPVADTIVPPGFTVNIAVRRQ